MLTKTIGLPDLNICEQPSGFSQPGACRIRAHQLLLIMNRRVKRQIFIALGIFAGIILLFVVIAQVGG
jgi:hypothetical protein